MSWEQFHFLRPYWLLALLPVLFLIWRAWRNRIQSGDWSKVVDAHLLPHLLDNPGQRQRGRWLWLLFIGWLLTVIALAGPAWQKQPQPLFMKESALVILLDLSRSMDATDVSPSRITHARHRVLDLLENRKEGQTGLVVYTDQAYVIAPLTDDNATIANLVPTLETTIMPSQGSHLSVALKRAEKMLNDAGIKQAHLIVISDGVTDDKAFSVAESLASQQRRTSVLGIGTPQGSPIPLASGGFVKDRNGGIVIAKGDSNSLRKLAEAGSGIYQSLKFDGADTRNLLAFANGDNQSIKSSERQNSHQGWSDEGIWLLLPILLLAALTFRRGWLMSALLCAVLIQPQPSYAFEWPDHWSDLWANQNQQAARAMQDKQYQQAAEQFKDPLWKASALYRAGDYQQAAEAYSQFDSADAHYNRGNALAKAGNLPEAIKAYEAALKKEPDHKDAQANLELLNKMLEQQQQQSSDQQQQGDQAQNDQQQGQGQDQSQSGSQQDAQQQQQQGEQGQQDQQSQQNDDQQQSEQQTPSAKKSDQQEQQSAQSEAEQQDQQDKESQQALQQRDEEPTDENKDQDQQQLQQMSEQDAASKEQLQAMEQWLRRIPDDPGGLLRRKLQHQYQRQQQNRTKESEQPW